MHTSTFEFTLHPTVDHYAVTARFVAPQHDERYTALPLTLDFAALRSLLLDPDAYGQALTAQLFADAGLRAFWAKARTVAFQNGELAVRLRLPAADTALHVLRWETLRDPEDAAPFVLSQRVRLARTLDGGDFTPLPLAPRPGTLRALVAVAAPSDLAAYGLAEIDADGEVARVRAAVGDTPLTVLGDVAGAQGRATLEAIQVALNDGLELVFLIAHGALDSEGQPVIYLEDRNGLTAPTPGPALVEAMRQQARRPMLFTLVSCRGAGDDYAALSAVGPQLAQVGLPAVLAFQGAITMAATKRLLPSLITELKRDGVIDRALAAARAAMGRGGPWWQPVLFLRGDGRLWKEQTATSSSVSGISIGGNVGTVQQINVSGGNVGSIIGSQTNYGAPTPNADTQTITLRNRLANHREALATYLNQLSIVGEANARPEVTAGIRSARSEIRRIKAYLRSSGEHVHDQFNDEE